MQRAQVRDAARSSKFYFRKSVLPPGHTSPTASTPSSSGDSSPADCSDCTGLPRKETKLRNCFPTVPRPANGGWRCPVETEYEEMSMDEIMNGRVWRIFHIVRLSSHICFSSAPHFQACWVSWTPIWTLWTLTRKAATRYTSTLTSSNDGPTVSSPSPDQQ